MEQVNGRYITEEVLARVIYDSWIDQPGWVPWVAGGNSDRQDEARRKARAALSAAPAQEPQEGKALTDERILHLWDTYVAYETGASAKQPPLGADDKLAFARAVERELRGAQEVKAGEWQDWQDIPDALIAGILRFAWRREPTLSEITAAAKAACPPPTLASTSEGKTE